MVELTVNLPVVDKADIPPTGHSFSLRAVSGGEEIFPLMFSRTKSHSHKGEREVCAIVSAHDISYGVGVDCVAYPSSRSAIDVAVNELINNRHKAVGPTFGPITVLWYSSSELQPDACDLHLLSQIVYGPEMLTILRVEPTSYRTDFGEELGFFWRYIDIDVLRYSLPWGFVARSRVERLRLEPFVDCSVGTELIDGVQFEKELVTRTIDAMCFGLPTSSKFFVGATLMINRNGGEVTFVSAGNVEYKNMVQGSCAEANAVRFAITGCRIDAALNGGSENSGEARRPRVVAAAVAISSIGVTASPCGQCRQLLMEMGDFPVLLMRLNKHPTKEIDLTGSRVLWSKGNESNSLLPFGFALEGHMNALDQDYQRKV